MSIVLLGSTSGSCTLQEQAIAGTTTLTLPTTSGTVLTDTSPKAGNVIQVVQATTQTIVINSTTTYADSGLTASITPTSSSSKVLVLVSQSFYLTIGTGSSQYGGFQIVRNSTAIYTPAQDGTSSFDYGVGVGNSTSVSLFTRYSACYLDSPATTSATTYKTQMRIYYPTSGGAIYAQNSNGTSSIILMEVAG
jgi:hypothetical protein